MGLLGGAPQPHGWMPRFRPLSSLLTQPSVWEESSDRLASSSSRCSLQAWGSLCLYLTLGGSPSFFALIPKPYPSTWLPTPKVAILSSTSHSLISQFVQSPVGRWLAFHRGLRDGERARQHPSPCHLDLCNRDTVPSSPG